MAEGITLKRIIDMDEATELSSSDYALVDSATGGPKKFALGEELSSLKEDYTTILDSAYVTDTASGAIASFPDGADNVPVKSLNVNIEPEQSGSGDPSPTNIRPISGHATAKVTRTGKNLFDNSRTSTLIDCYDINGVAQIRKGYYESLPSGTYTISATLLQNSAYIYINVINKDGTYASFRYLCAGTRITNATITLSEGQYLAVYDSQSDADATPDKFGNIQIQIELGSTVTAYEPYNGQTVTIDLGQTVYGGTLDVLTGVLTVDRAIVDMGTLPWNKISGSGSVVGYQTASVPNIKPNSSDSAIANIVCSAFKPSSVNNGYSGTDKECITENTVGRVTVYTDGGYADGTAFKNAMVGQTFVYPLATPQVIQLTANDIETLLGQNNIWSDAGTVDVTYRADTKLYIEKLTAPTEDDMVADHAISANTFFMIGNTLYRATTAIASGATITVGTNATKLSLSDALNALA